MTSTADVFDKKDQFNFVFPFTAIVGQEEMKISLLLNVVDPKIGGVMIMGDRGTGKTTTIRALVDILPDILVVKDDPYNSHPHDVDLMSSEVQALVLNRMNIETCYTKVPLVDLPLGATEDRVCGSIDIEKALSEGKKSFEPGLLAKANRGLLYVDEINLLDDHLVDVLLDCSASGWNLVEREGISVKHPSKFVLIGSGNPEEGELRPQLLDRFGLHAEIKTVKDPELRVKIVEERTEFDKDPVAYIRKFSKSQDELREKIINAQNLLPKVEMPRELKFNISKICGILDIDGLRGDIVTNRASKAYAAIQQRNVVEIGDIQKVIVSCLRHRLRKDPLEIIESGEKIQKAFTNIF
uniref:Magnesium-chelatase subunit ChlI n=1 Tax=Cyanidium caldarium TaxID=2771 RepID=CHLI_CYACA|nr:Mg-protoporyphyrin IX chelatase [Cyanidium caldarium]Q9TLX7.1 RecName: Full=Magnesium-chelatase subunit ChlI; AltName: Full=Mg-protoporphyrin IX chelatase [Cyanidium caldarium]AAF12953.1 unknown [Cyanidium caldarium]WDB00264.1 Mg-protoporyphyrin IX chelatase [Cyanidium caldarium]